MIIKKVKMLYKNLRSWSFVFIFLVSGCTFLSGQDRSRDVPPLKDRLFYGGSFGLQLGTITDIQVSPVVGMWVLPRVGVALGPSYRYYKDYFGNTDIYGGRTYVQLIAVQDLNSVIPLGVHLGIFLHGEYEVLSLESEVWKLPPYSSDRFLVNTLLGGGGFSQQIGRRSSINFTFLWALTDSGYEIYNNPEIRVSFVF
jgi:hypothetical protein